MKREWPIRAAMVVSLTLALVAILSAQSPLEDEYFEGQVILLLSPSMPVPDRSVLRRKSLGVASADAVMRTHDVVSIERLAPEGRSYTSPAGRRVARTFRVRYAGGTDPESPAQELSRLVAIASAR